MLANNNSSIFIFKINHQIEKFKIKVNFKKKINKKKYTIKTLVLSKKMIMFKSTTNNIIQAEVNINPKSIVNSKAVDIKLAAKALKTFNN